MSVLLLRLKLRHLETQRVILSDISSKHQLQLNQCCSATTGAEALRCQCISLRPACSLQGSLLQQLCCPTSRRGSCSSSTPGWHTSKRYAESRVARLLTLMKFRVLKKVGSRPMPAADAQSRASVSAARLKGETRISNHCLQLMLTTCWFVHRACIKCANIPRPQRGLGFEVRLANAHLQRRRQPHLQCGSDVQGFEGLSVY